MPSLVPGIHVLAAKEDVDGRDKPGHDDEEVVDVSGCRLAAVDCSLLAATSEVLRVVPSSPRLQPWSIGWNLKIWSDGRMMPLLNGLVVTAIATSLLSPATAIAKPAGAKTSSKHCGASQISSQASLARLRISPWLSTAAIPRRLERSQRALSRPVRPIRTALLVRRAAQVWMGQTRIPSWPLERR